MKALYSAAVPNTASERQTVPQAYNPIKMIGYLPLNVGRQANSQCFRKSRQHTFKIAGYPACLIAGMQESKIAGMLESGNAC